jgi:hypothetical protein
MERLVPPIQVRTLPSIYGILFSILIYMNINYWKGKCSMMGRGNKSQDSRREGKQDSAGNETGSARSRFGWKQEIGFRLRHVFGLSIASSIPNRTVTNNICRAKMAQLGNRVRLDRGTSRRISALDNWNWRRDFAKLPLLDIPWGGDHKS